MTCDHDFPWVQFLDVFRIITALVATGSPVVPRWSHRVEQFLLSVDNCRVFGGKRFFSLTVDDVHLEQRQQQFGVNYKFYFSIINRCDRTSGPAGHVSGWRPQALLCWRPLLFFKFFLLNFKKSSPSCPKSFPICPT